MEKLDGLRWEEPLYSTCVIGDKNNGAPNNSTSQFSVSAGKKMDLDGKNHYTVHVLVYFVKVSATKKHK
ncbi:hypothetical protein H5410_004590 [Solanum commersonii]|uniref:Uncharacterized protein n=1 Tax=Solanum commersonii TaxID=4109 RepID=A0A9J6B884_SOLCO|nr:hypothetical protein H5410_004590 [Solanum commersonii]